jgi:catechol 2,3-dioxygenase-like lactoylglutathione lyase family enzyme
MFSHVMVGANDLDRAKRFYDAVFGAIGLGEGVRDDANGRRRFVYRSDGGSFYITQPLDGGAATHANGGTIGFRCKSTDEVDRWHAAGIANGGESVEAAPGVRFGSTAGLYLAYLRDPDGNKICAVCRM